MNAISAPSGQALLDATALQAVVAARRRPTPPGRLSVVLTFAWRGLLKIRHMPEQLGDVIFIPIIFTLVFTYLFGGGLAGSTDAYLRYLLPGTLVMSVLLVTIYSGVTLNADITSGVSDRFRSIPIWQPAHLVGMLLGDTARYILGAGLVIGLGLVMGYRPDGGPAGVAAAVALVLVFAFSVSWVWTTLGLVLRTPNAIQVSGTVVFFPLTFASNVFVNPDTTPPWLEAFIGVNPISHLVTAVRGLMAGTVAPAEIAIVLATCAVLVAVFAPLTMARYRRRT